MGKVTPMPQQFPADVKALLSPRQAVMQRENDACLDIVKAFFAGAGIDHDANDVSVDFLKGTYTVTPKVPEAG